MAQKQPRGALPAYVQIAEQVAREISAGHWIVGDRLPPERDMSKDYGVAVGTLRKSLDQLRAQGLIESIQGSGNYIAATENSASIYAFFRLELPGGGGLPRAELVSVDKIRKPKDLPKFGTSDLAHRFRRLRYLDDTPAALEEIWLDGALVHHINANDISQSLYHYYKEHLGLWITRAEDLVSVAPVPEWTVDQFPLKSESMAGYVERFGWDQSEKCMEYSRNWFDPQAVRYVARLK